MVDGKARLRELARWGLLGVAGVILVVHSLAYNFVTDDAYISFVYSRNFAEHGELAFNLGDPVEGYTNFSWTVLLGLLMKLGIEPELSSRVIGTLCALATLYVVTRTMDRALGRKTPWSAVPALILACSSGFACWTSGGLETQLFTLLVAAAIDGVVAAVDRPRALRRAAVCLALAAMTRPEGPLVAAVLGAVWILHRVIEKRRGVPTAIARPATSAPAWWRRVLAIGGGVVMVAFFFGGILLVPRFGAFREAIAVPWIVAVIIAGLAVGVPLFGLFDCVAIARGDLRKQIKALGAGGLSLAGLGVVTMALAIRAGVDAPLVPWALVAIALGAAMLGTRAAIAPPWPWAGNELLAAAWFLGAWLPWFLWRWWYYGYPFPNTYYVKAAGEWTSPEFASTMLSNGAYYIWVWLVQTKLLYASPLVVLGLAAVRGRTPRFVLAVGSALLLVVYGGYAIAVGGDFMGLHRFIMPLFVVAAIAVTLGLEWLASKLPRDQVAFPASVPAIGALMVLGVALLAFTLRFMPDDPRDLRALRDTRSWVPLLTVVVVGGVLIVKRTDRTGLAVAACALLVGAFATTQVHLTARSLDPKNLAADRGVIDTPAFLIVYTEDRAKIGRAMAPCFRDDDFSIVGGAGAQPYYGRMRGIDVFGLVSDKIAHREPRSRPRAGHTKWGSESLLAEYSPDFVFSCYRLHKTAAAPPLPCAGYWLARGFEQVTVRVPGLQEQGEYYTFLARKTRNFQCPLRIH